VGCGEVIAFADVFAEVVEFEAVVFEEFEEFPIAVADGTGGGRAPGVFTGAEIAGEMPVEGRAGSLRSFSLEHGEVAGAVEGVLRGRGEVGDFEEGGVVIDGVDGEVGFGCGCDDAGPAGDVGDANASFVEHALAAVEGGVVGDFLAGFYSFASISADASVVAGEDDECVVGELEFVESFADAAD